MSSTHTHTLSIYIPIYMYTARYQGSRSRHLDLMELSFPHNK